MKAEKWQFEYKNLHDKYEALVKEKEVKALFNLRSEFIHPHHSIHDPCTHSSSTHHHYWLIKSYVIHSVIHPSFINPINLSSTNH